MAIPQVQKNAFRQSFQMLDEIADHDYETSLCSLARDKNFKQRKDRLVHVIGVAMKKKFSVPVEKQKAASGESDIRWRIVESKLNQTPADYWSLRVLRRAPDKWPGESSRDFAVRLHRETLLGRQYLKTVHKYICNDPKTRKKVVDILKDAHLGAFAKLATPEGIITAGGWKLMAVLMPVMPWAGAIGVSIAVITMVALGLETLCADSGETKRTAKTRNTKAKRR